MIVDASERELSRRTQISVIGSSRCGEDSEIWRLAEDVGRLLAEAGATVVCGGRGGVMEAAARGAARAGGEVIGIVPGVSIEEANPHCTHVVASGIGFARNLAVVASGDAVIAVGGAWGTLSEIGHARVFERTVIALRSWGLAGSEEMSGAPGVVVVETPAEAVATALEAAAG
ncbi:MAG TPA: TIGR00725 family protein [Solirubrobacterales bacterium]